MRMFGWSQGEFRFEIRDDVVGDHGELLLPTGINTQYLAMEATRLGDELERPEPEPVFSGETAEPGSSEAESDPVSGVVSQVMLQGPASQPGLAADDPGTRRGTRRRPPPGRSRRRRRGRQPSTWSPSIRISRASSGSRPRWTPCSSASTSSSVAAAPSIGFASTWCAAWCLSWSSPRAVRKRIRMERRSSPGCGGLSSGITILTLRSDSAPGGPAPGTDGVLVRPVEPTADPGPLAPLRGLRRAAARGAGVVAPRSAARAAGRCGGVRVIAACPDCGARYRIRPAEASRWGSPPALLAL